MDNERTFYGSFLFEKNIVGQPSLYRKNVNLKELGMKTGADMWLKSRVEVQWVKTKRPLMKKTIPYYSRSEI